jgi:hypothetical protein
MVLPMKINPPFGYPEITVLSKNQRVILPKAGVAPDFCRELNLLPVSFSEFPRASHDFPIVFVSSNQGETFGAVALTGLQAGQNLFVGADGNWDRSAYMPAYVRRYPFCMARVNREDGTQQDERVVCVAQQAVDGQNGEALFDGQGAAMPRWVEMEKLLREYEADLLRSGEMCALLKEYDLLEPFSMQAALGEGGAMQLGGMHRVREQKLATLKVDQFRTLLKKGMMGRIYAHLLSLDGFARLFNRSVKMQSEKAGSAGAAGKEPALG